MKRTTLPIGTEKARRLSRIRDQAIVAQLHLNHMHHTQPPAWMYLSDEELAALEGALALVVMSLASMRQRANVDNGPYSGRKAASCP